MSTSIALDLDALEKGDESPKGEIASAKLASSANVPQNVTDFPGGGIDLKGIVVNLLIEGKSVGEIAQVTGKTEQVIDKLVTSDVVIRALTIAVGKQEGDDAQQTSVRSLMRAFAPATVVRIKELTKCGHPPTELQACKVLLEYTLLPAKEKDIAPTQRKNLGTNPDQLAKEYAETKAKIEQEQAKRRF